MKHIYKSLVRKIGHYLMLAVVICLTGSSRLSAQNLVANSNFAGGSFTGWNTNCTYEINPETTYGGPSNSTYVTEIDVERCVNQEVCIIPGLTYILTYSAGRRISASTPANPGLQMRVTGMTTGNNYVNWTQAFNNTTWNLTPYSVSITIPAGSADRKVNIQFTDYNNPSTYGVLISDIQLNVAAWNALSINGPSTTSVNSPVNFSVTHAPASGVSYNWSFAGGGTPSSSTSAAPAGIRYSSIGSKTVSVDEGNGTCTMASYTKSLTVSAILPSQMLSFEGVLKENAGMLSWVTSDETNNKYFIVERSSNGGQFDSIGIIPGTNNPGTNKYNFTDTRLLNGSNYYRLRQVDIDGIARYSKVISLNNAGAAAGKIQVFPNPALSVLNYTVTSAAAELVNVQIYSLSGILVQSSQQQLSAGLNQRSLTVGDLRDGSYFLKITGKQGATQLVQVFTKI